MATQTGQMYNTFNYLIPQSGTTHVYASVIQASATPYVGNFQAVQFNGVQFRPQAAWFDNSQSSNELVFNIPAIGFRLNIPAGANIAYNFPSIEGFSYTVTGGGQATIFFADFPLLPSSASVTLPNTSNVDIVQSIQLDTLNQNPASAPVFVEAVAQQAQTKSAVIAASSTSTTITPPASSLKLTKLSLSITGNATLATAGIETITSTINGTTVLTDAVYIPSAAINNAQLYEKVWELDYAGFEMSTYDLVINLSTALATGQVTINAFFTVN